MALFIRVLSFGIVIVNSKIGMASHTSQKDLSTGTERPMEGRFPVVPLTGEEGIPTRLSFYLESLPWFIKLSGNALYSFFMV